jgi:hypothetical protein
MTDSILNFMNGEVTKYLIPDINRLSALRPQGAEGAAGCAIPTAMLLFATTDLFGFLVRDDSRNPKLDDTKANLKAIFSHPLGDFASEYTDRLATLVYLYRHGLMHQIFPKAAGIRKPGTTSRLFDFIDGLDHLNVDRFTIDVVKMFVNFKDSLPKPEWANLRTQMSQRLDEMAKRDFHEMQEKSRTNHLS